MTQHTALMQRSILMTQHTALMRRSILTTQRTALMRRNYAQHTHDYPALVGGQFMITWAWKVTPPAAHQSRVHIPKHTQRLLTPTQP